MKPKNLLRGTRCYLIGGMQYENGEGWRATVEKSLRSCGIKFFNPYAKPFINDIPEHDDARKQLLDWMKNGEYSQVAYRMRDIRAHDLRLVDISDFLICHINPKRMSWGTQEEITTAVREKKPVYISVEGGKRLTPLWLLGMIPHEFIFNSIDEVITRIKRLDANNLAMSGSWKLLRPEYR